MHLTVHVAGLAQAAEGPGKAVPPAHLSAIPGTQSSLECVVTTLVLSLWRASAPPGRSVKLQVSEPVSHPEILIQYARGRACGDAVAIGPEIAL